MRPLLLALVLLAPLAAAGVPFEAEVEDARDDVLSQEGKPVTAQSADILRLTSRVEGERIVQRVEMAARPTAPSDSILVRSWFDDSTNGSFWVVDMEVRGELPADSRFRAVVRRGDFANATAIDDARWGVENATWIFDFPAAVVADAACFDPGAFAERQVRYGVPAFDSAYLEGARRCRTAPEPQRAAPPPISIGVPTYEPPPGGATPTPGPGLAGLLVALGAVALASRWR